MLRIDNQAAALLSPSKHLYEHALTCYASSLLQAYRQNLLLLQFAALWVGAVCGGDKCWDFC
jgi:hypothetical protein